MSETHVDSIWYGTRVCAGCGNYAFHDRVAVFRDAMVNSLVARSKKGIHYVIIARDVTAGVLLCGEKCMGYYGRCVLEVAPGRRSCAYLLKRNITKSRTSRGPFAL